MKFLLEYKEYAGIDDTISDAELVKLEAKWGVQFPVVYREVFMILGKHYAFEIGGENSYSYPDFGGMRNEAKEIVAVAGVDIQVGRNDFVFCCTEDIEAFWFFKLNEGDNPPVYFFQNGNEDYTMVASSFSAFVKMQSWYQYFLKTKDRG